MGQYIKYIQRKFWCSERNSNVTNGLYSQNGEISNRSRKICQENINFAYPIEEDTYNEMPQDLKSIFGKRLKKQKDNIKTCIMEQQF